MEQRLDFLSTVIAINGWNRLNIAFRTTPGTYEVGMSFAA